MIKETRGLPPRVLFAAIFYLLIFSNYSVEMHFDS